MKSCKFECGNCFKSDEACIEDYIVSGFRPGRADDCAFYLFEAELLNWWHYLQHKVPGTSGNKFLETLEDMSRSHSRVS